MSDEPKGTVKGFRQVVQDLLVPELRSIKTEIVYMKEEIKTLRVDTKNAIDLNSQKIEKLTEITLRLAERFDVSQKYAELSERLARLEEKVSV